MGITRTAEWRERQLTALRQMMKGHAIHAVVRVNCFILVNLTQGVELKLATSGLVVQSNNHLYEPKDGFTRLFPRYL
jgi:hypothetical protein